MATLGLVVFALLILAAIRWGVRGCLSWLAMLFIGWLIYDASRRAIHDATKHLLDQMARDINTIIGALSVALVLSRRAAGGVILASGVLDAADAYLRLRNVGVRRDTSQENLAGAVASLLNVHAKIILLAGLDGGGPAVTGVGLAMIITAELLKLALAHTNSLSEYRQLLLDL